MSKENTKKIKVLPIKYPKESIYWDSKNLNNYIKSKLKILEHKYYPSIVCQNCGSNASSKQYSCSTWYEDFCQVCGEYTSCTEVRDFYYPEFEIDLELRKENKVKSLTSIIKTKIENSEVFKKLNDLEKSHTKLIANEINNYLNDLIKQNKLQEKITLNMTLDKEGIQEINVNKTYVTAY